MLRAQIQFVPDRSAILICEVHPNNKVVQGCYLARGGQLSSRAGRRELCLLVLTTTHFSQGMCQPTKQSQMDSSGQTFAALAASLSQMRMLSSAVMAAGSPGMAFAIMAVRLYGTSFSCHHRYICQFSLVKFLPFAALATSYTYVCVCIYIYIYRYCTSGAI